MIKVLELGSYILPAYAGMVLAEQGYEVTKWTNPAGDTDPVQGLHRGGELWEWINFRKSLQQRHVRDVTALHAGDVDLVVDNIRSAAWDRWDIDPALEAKRLGVPWVSMRDEFDGRSFDAVAQARALMEHGDYQPYYIGDTSGGLWLAYKAIVLVQQGAVGHHILRQSSCLAKLVEGELVVAAPRANGHSAWDVPGTYGSDGEGVKVLYRGEPVVEPTRDHAWKMANLHHDGTGRIII